MVQQKRRNGRKSVHCLVFEFLIVYKGLHAVRGALFKDTFQRGEELERGIKLSHGIQWLTL